MSSVCSKVLLLSFSGVQAEGWRLKLFVWLSFVVDFFGAFFLVSFAFYTPSDSEQQWLFAEIQSLCLWQFVLCILPFAVIGSVGLHVFWTMEMIKEAPKLALCWVMGITMLWIIGLFLCFLVMSIFTTIWAAFGVMAIGISSRMPLHAPQKEFYLKRMDWIRSGEHKHDKVVRLALTNKVLMDVCGE